MQAARAELDAVVKERRRIEIEAEQLKQVRSERRKVYTEGAT